MYSGGNGLIHLRRLKLSLRYTTRVDYVSREEDVDLTSRDLQFLPSSSLLLYTLETSLQLSLSRAVFHLEK